MSQFSDSLRSIRKQSQKKQREAAEYLGINIRTYQNYEGGKSEPSIPQLIRLADFFMVSLDELVGRDWIGRS
ncbi:MAG: helix-turn-helix transcriptional regulator [Lawsonibacter sp.]|nr:helix-turn-helix transcriptional regulator [Lawsonibacter sp.]